MVLSNLQKKILIKQLEYNLTSNISDTNKLIKVSKLSSNSLIEYLRGEPELVYPVKSYAVAIVYSLLLERRYKISFWDSISNDLLLCNNDRFFVSYKKNKKIYKRCISFFGKNNILNLDSNSIKIISQYFYEEFGKIEI